MPVFPGFLEIIRVVMEIEKDPENILQVLKERSKKEETPGAKDSKH